jgi:hypothetical protein
VKQIPDEVLHRLIPILLETETETADRLHMIGQDYHVAQTLTITDDISRANATKTRQQLLQSGQLLAIIAVGIVIDQRHAVVEYYPARGQLETYALTYSKPQTKAIWSDPEEPEVHDAVQFFKGIWRLE